ncbi:MAG: sigma-70 family RNA polymerase sigma factor [Spirochaetales bacterium]|nr:sigma-70 family RNA polymerase sigma factor [Spirochaetales bacterium]
MEFTHDFIRQLKAGKKEAFERLYELTWASLLGFIQFKLRGNRETSEDILSEVYYDAMLYAGTLTAAHNLMSWLYRIARSKIVDYYRKMKREDALIRVQKTIVREKNILNYFSDSPSSEVLRREEDLILRIGLSRLSSGYREVLRLKYEEKKSVTELARAAGKTEKSIESLLFRARRKLEEELRRAMKEKIYEIREGGEINAGKSA